MFHFLSSKRLVPGAKRSGEKGVGDWSRCTAQTGAWSVNTSHLGIACRPSGLSFTPGFKEKQSRFHFVYHQMLYKFRQSNHEGHSRDMWKTRTRTKKKANYDLNNLLRINLSAALLSEKMPDSVLAVWGKCKYELRKLFVVWCLFWRNESQARKGRICTFDTLATGQVATTTQCAQRSEESDEENSLIMPCNITWPFRPFSGSSL